MKNVLFTLALLVSSCATAAVKVDVTARFGEHKTEQSFELNVEEAVLFEEGDIKTLVSLTSEDEKGANFSLHLYEGDNELLSTPIQLSYGEVKTLKCPIEELDQELTMRVTQLEAVQEAA